MGQGPGKPKQQAPVTAADFAADTTSGPVTAADFAPTGETAWEGANRGAKNALLGGPRFARDVLQGVSAYTPEELRTPEVREYLKSQGEDPDAMLHESLRRRGRGEPIGPLETLAHAGKGMATMGMSMENAILPGPNLGNIVYDAITGKKSGDEYTEQNAGEIAHQFEPGNRAAGFAEMIGGAGLLG